MKRLLVFLLVSFALAAQTPSCTQKGTLATATTFTAFTNNTANPNCNSWALTWNSTGFTALAIQLQGSDDGTTYTAYTGTSTVVVGTNPSTALSGATVIQASTKLAFVQVKLNSVTGTGAVNFQLYGYNGVTPTAKLSGGGPGATVNWANVLAGTNTQGFLQVGAPTVIEPTAMNPGGIYATQVVDGNDLPAITVTTPAGPGVSVDQLDVAPTVSATTATVVARTKGLDPNIHLELQSKGTAAVQFQVPALSVDPTGQMTADTGTSIGPAGAGVVNSNQVNGAVIPASAPVAATNASRQVIAGTTSGTGSTVLLQGSPVITTPTVADFTNSQHTHANAAGAGQLDNTAVKTVNKAGVGSSFAMTAALGASGNCANWNANGVGDSGSPCGSGGSGGGGVVTYSGPTLSILSGTAFCPIGGGGACSATESNVDIDSSATATVSKLYVQLSAALGAGNSVAVTWRANSSSQTVTCTISGASATSCNDTTHSFTATTGDLLDYQLVFTGTILVTPTISIMSAFGTSNVGVTSVTGTAPVSCTAGTTPVCSAPTAVTGSPTNHGTMIGGTTQAATYGSAGTNGQVWTSNGPSSDPTFQTAASTSFPLTFVQESQQSSTGNGATFTITFPQTTAASGNTAWLIVSIDGSAAVTNPAGWTQDINQVGATFSRLIVLHKTTASDTSATFTIVGSNGSAYFFELSGAHTFDASSVSSSANSANVTLPAITPTANSVVFGVAAFCTTAPGEIASPVNPRWHPLIIGNVINGSRTIAGVVSTVAATNTSTTPPQLSLFNGALCGSGGIAFASFSIL